MKYLRTSLICDHFQKGLCSVKTIINYLIFLKLKNGFILNFCNMSVKSGMNNTELRWTTIISKIYKERLIEIILNRYWGNPSRNHILPPFKEETCVFSLVIVSVPASGCFDWLRAYRKTQSMPQSVESRPKSGHRVDLGRGATPAQSQNG